MRANNRTARTRPRTPRSKSPASVPQASPAAPPTETPRTPARKRGKSTSPVPAPRAADKCAGTAIWDRRPASKPHAPVIVRKSDRPFVQMKKLQELREPTLGAEVGQHAFGDQHRP